MLAAMGFTRAQCVKALQQTDNNVERAVDWIFSHTDEINNLEEGCESALLPAAPAPPPAAAESDLLNQNTSNFIRFQSSSSLFLLAFHRFKIIMKCRL